jgi:iron complex transport system permease protein
MIGSNGIDFSDISKLVSFDERFMIIFEEIRLPRTMAACLVGGALGLSGALMQGVLKNPLASPFTLGVSQAGAFGASFAIIVLQSYSDAFNGTFLTTICAFVASLVCIAIILYFGKFTAMRAESLILAGVAIGAVFGAGTMFLQYFADEVDVSATIFWTFGDLAKGDIRNSFILAIVLFPSVWFFYRIFWKFDALMLGNESAVNLGISVVRLRILAMVVSSLLSALAVAFFGIIGFIGLIAPHIVRLLVGHSHSYVIPFSVISGAILLLGADIVARTVLSPLVVPVGIFTSFIGAPLFLYLLSRRAK